MEYFSSGTAEGDGTHAKGLPGGTRESRKDCHVVPRNGAASVNYFGVTDNSRALARFARGTPTGV